MSFYVFVDNGNSCSIQYEKTQKKCITYYYETLKFSNQITNTKNYTSPSLLLQNYALTRFVIVSSSAFNVSSVLYLMLIS